MSSFGENLSELLEKYEHEFDSKKSQLISSLQPFCQHDLDCFSSPPKNYRMRAEFRVWHEGDKTFHIMFDQATKTRFQVDQLDVACSLINQAMFQVMKYINLSQILRTKLFQIDYLAATTGQIVISMIYHKPLTDDWTENVSTMLSKIEGFTKVNIIGRSKKQKVVLGNDYVIEKFEIKGKQYTFKQIENSFTQPNAIINEKMISWAIDNSIHHASDLLELYCGAGNFSIPLSNYYRNVLGTEISKTSVNAAQYNIAENTVDNLNIARLSSEEFVQAFNGVRKFNRLANIDLLNYKFKTVLVDPPRSGLDDKTLELVSSFDQIIYISCNPNTLVENLSTLCKTHEISKAAFFDQFPFTPHIEAGVVLNKIT